MKLTESQRHWLLDQFLEDGGLQADSGSARDKKLREIEKTGALKHYDSMFGNNYYSLTDKGRAIIAGKGREP